MDQSSELTIVPRLTRFLTQLISETNGLSLADTLILAHQAPQLDSDREMAQALREFHGLVARAPLRDPIFGHPVSKALGTFFRSFPIPFRDEHIHLTGTLDAEFIYPRLLPLLEQPLYQSKIREVYGADALPIRSAADVDRLIRVRDEDRFERYLRVLYLAKLVLNSREAHRDAAYRIASRLYRTSNVGALRLQFTLFRETTESAEQVPGIGSLTPEDVLLGLYEGFRSFQSEVPAFHFILSPSFRKE